MDPRYVRKETEIRVPLLKLLETTPIADISTTALCKQAGISRNTFYCHYPSPAALLETIENEFIDLIVGIVDSTIDSDYESLLRQICQAMLDNRKLATLLLSDNGNRRFLERMVGTMHSQIMTHWTKSGIALDVDDLELLFTYTTYGVERCIRRWSDNGFRESPEVLARKLRNMSEYMLAHYMEQPFI